ncbi:MAG: hypothetical protein C5B50_26825 [Verrucomicrobia bacterium]|nr:MAG: hypothetical protein C5B50_26825 [Verrucomicrobiota bacterium]
MARAVILQTTSPAMPLASHLDSASTAAPPRKRRKLMVLLASLAGALLAAEFCLRAWACFNAGSLRPLLASAIPHTRVWRADPVRNHARLEGIRFIATGDPPGLEYCTGVEISSQGLNNELVPIPKPRGEFRILVLGDSFVEAIQVPRSQNFCKQLESILGEKLKSEGSGFRVQDSSLLSSAPETQFKVQGSTFKVQGFSSLGTSQPAIRNPQSAISSPRRPTPDSRPSSIRAINAGISTYSPLLEYLYFTGDLASFKPDVVIQVFFSNDVYDDMRYTAIAQFDPQGIPIAVGPGDHWIVFPHGQSKNASDRDQWAFRHSLSESAPWVARQFYCAALIHHFAAAWQLRGLYSQPPVNDEFFILESEPALAEPQQEGWKLTQKYIKLLKEACDKSGAHFLLTSAPIASQVYGQTSYDHFFFKGKPTDADQVHLKQIAADLGVPFVDVPSPLRTAGAGLYFPRDGHWTAKGHRIAAETLAPEVWKIMEERLRSHAP